jgi:hypothetical protein
VLTKTTIGVAAILVLSAASVAPAIAASKARNTKQAPPAQYQYQYQYQYANQTPPAQYIHPGQGRRSDGGPHSPNPANDVYTSGYYSGSDPDPRIRMMLLHDPPWSRNGNR